MSVKTVVRYGVLVWLGTLLINAHLIGAVFLSRLHSTDLGEQLVETLCGIFSGAWVAAWLMTWLSVGARYPFVPLIQIALLIWGFVIWLRRPNLLNAAVLSLLGMCAGPVGVYVFGYPVFFLPIAVIVLLAGFLLHRIWRHYAASRFTFEKEKKPWSY